MMVDAVLKEAALKGSLDNLTVTIICFKGFKDFLGIEDALSLINEELDRFSPLPRKLSRVTE
jgi:hypothetical protein